MRRTHVRIRPQLVEGLWFALPINETELAVGIITAMSHDGSRLFGYFFGPRLRATPSLENVVNRTCDEAVLAARFSNLGLRYGRWTVLGPDPDYSRDKWPMPRFRNEDVVSGRIRVVEYDRDKPDRLVSFRDCDKGEAQSLPEDGLMGHLYVEDALNAILPRVAGGECGEKTNG